VRESRSTPRGSRSRTLATFKVLDDDVLDHAEARAERPFHRQAVIAAAHRLHAPIAPSGVDLRAANLIIELDGGHAMRPGLRRLLQKRLRDEPPDPADHHLERMLPWMRATAEERSETIVELLGVVDAMPGRDWPRRYTFPHLWSARR
jgi:hypothetical protein